MTYKDIHKKYMIEYDKENVTSSYPSLTTYEIATILDKAYLALIAQKLTGNQQRVPFEGDIKAIEDVRNLIASKKISKSNATLPIDNAVIYKLSDILYFLTALVLIDGKLVTTNLVNHEIAKNFMHTATNRPWIKNSVCYIEGDNLIVLYDDYSHKNVGDLQLTYIKQPDKFVDHIIGKTFDDTQFELNDTMIEELISLAIIMSLETVESPRLQTKLNTKALES